MFGSFGGHFVGLSHAAGVHSPCCCALVPWWNYVLCVFNASLAVDETAAAFELLSWAKTVAKVCTAEAWWKK